MKKIMILCLSVSTLLACNNSTETSTVNEEQIQEQEQSVATETEHAATIEGLALNNGVKWDGDEATNNNVKNLETILQDFQPSSNIGDYESLANNLQTGLDKMISECRMKGADHDALHAWLEPLIVKVKNLKTTTDVSVAEASTQDIKEHVQIYHTYFE